GFSISSSFCKMGVAINSPISLFCSKPGCHGRCCSKCFNENLSHDIFGDYLLFFLHSFLYCLKNPWNKVFYLYTEFLPGSGIVCPPMRWRKFKIFLFLALKVYKLVA